MTIAEVKTLLKSITGFETKVVYYAWPDGEAPDLPFICFYTPYANNFGADDCVHYSATHFFIELYSDDKDTESEGKVEAALKDIYYTKSETFIPDEKCYQVIYEIEV